MFWKKYDYSRTVFLQTYMSMSCTDVEVWIMMVMIALQAIFSWSQQPFFFFCFNYHAQVRHEIKDSDQRDSE